MEINIKEIIVQVVNFLILLFVLRIFAWKRLLNFLDERKAKISAEFKHIEESKVEIAKLRSEYAEKLSSIEDQAKEKIKEAIDEGKKISAEIKKDAYLKAQKIIETAKEDIKHELSNAKEELKKDIVDLAMRAAESVIQEKLSEEHDRKLIQDFLDNVAEMQ